MAAIETPEIKTKDKSDLDPGWHVVVHNDPVNLMNYVTLIFQRVFGFNRSRAEKHMMEVHKKGRSIVWTGNREKAELYLQQLHSHLLLATLEKAPQP
jgi:ATP-dependent Clp protease adaptor protein ClpS